MKKKSTKHEKTGKQEEIVQETPSIQEPEVRIVEKIVYKKQRVHGFFRTLTIITLLAVGILMLGESMGIAKITFNGFALDTVYPIFVIFSTIIIWSYRDLFGKIFGVILFLGVFGGFFTIRIYHGLNADTQTKFGQPIQYDMTGTKKEILETSTLIGNIDVEGNTKSPYIQGIRESDRPLLQNKTLSGDKEILSLWEDNTINVLEQYVSNLTIFGPKEQHFTQIYLKNGFGEESIDTTNLNRDTLTLHGAINKIMVKVTDTPSNSGAINIAGAIQDISISVPQDLGIRLLYKGKLGILSAPDMQQQSGYLYTSTNIAQAKKIITISINIALGRVAIKRQ